MVKHSLLLSFLTTCLLAAAPAAAQVVADHPWSRATPAGAGTGAVYLTLTSPTGDTLTGVSSPAASSASVHEMSMEGTIMHMREVPNGLALPANHPVTLQPGGYHVMLVGLRAPLKRGDTVALHLTFAKSAPIEIQAPILAIGAAAPAGTPAAAPMGAMTK